MYCINSKILHKYIIFVNDKFTNIHRNFEIYIYNAQYLRPSRDTMQFQNRIL